MMKARNIKTLDSNNNILEEAMKEDLSQMPLLQQQSDPTIEDRIVDSENQIQYLSRISASKEKAFIIEIKSESVISSLTHSGQGDEDQESCINHDEGKPDIVDSDSFLQKAFLI
eukprot:gene8733-9453_t